MIKLLLHRTRTSYDNRRYGRPAPEVNLHKVANFEPVTRFEISSGVKSKSLSWLCDVRMARWNCNDTKGHSLLLHIQVVRCDYMHRVRSHSY